ncbi:MAG: hypothetical protein HY399_00470 [Elusimicrobia bacterium]|nr:hypothetical protein [Elusimicrobiota bacterium]
MKKTGWIILILTAVALVYGYRHGYIYFRKPTLKQVERALPVELNPQKKRQLEEQAVRLKKKTVSTFKKTFMGPASQPRKI